MSNDKIKEELDKVLGGVIDDCILDDVIAIFKPAEPEVLRPYDFKGCNGHFINDIGEIEHSKDLSTELFAGTEAELEPITKQLKIMSLIQRLKKSTGYGDYEFVHGRSNMFIYQNARDKKWRIGEHNDMSCALIYFPNEPAQAIFEGFLAAVERGAE